MIITVNSANNYDFDISCNANISVAEEKTSKNRIIRKYQIDGNEVLNKIVIETHPKNKVNRYRLFKKKWIFFPFFFFLSFSSNISNSKFVLNCKVKETTEITICINNQFVSSQINGYICKPEFIITEKKKVTVSSTDVFFDKSKSLCGYIFSSFVNLLIQIIIVAESIVFSVFHPEEAYRSIRAWDWLSNVFFLVILIINLIHYIISFRKLQNK